MSSAGHHEHDSGDSIVPPALRPDSAPERDLGDFTTSSAVVWLSAVAVPVGVAVAFLALGLLDLIGLITHLAYTGTLATSLGGPDTSVLGPLSVAVPVAGGLIIGLMARVGSERIRGHGIPEAMETILLRGSRMEPRLAALKPISSAVSIGTGGPFGAEGPIIVTGGAIGVGYDTIDAELTGRLALGTLAVLLVVKLTVWAVALGSNTSGGILAPLLMLGAALGGLLGAVLPGADAGTWALLGMAAALAGVTRSPFTSIVFALELTHDVDALLALLVACTMAHLVSVLALKRSILTEKIARRGYHVSREYEVDPLHALLVRDVMAVDVLTIEPEMSVRDLYLLLPEGTEGRRQRLYPVVGADGSLAGVVAWSDLLVAQRDDSDLTVGELARSALVARPDETLRAAADRMVTSGHGVLPVVNRDEPGRLLGLVSQFDLLKAHERSLVEERHRERPLRPWRLLDRPATPSPVTERAP